MTWATGPIGPIVLPTAALGKSMGRKPEKEASAKVLIFKNQKSRFNPAKRIVLQVTQNFLR